MAYCRKPIIFYAESTMRSQYCDSATDQLEESIVYYATIGLSQNRNNTATSL